MERPEPGDSDLVAQLTGVRSSKPTFYPQYRDTAESLNRSITALESASSALTSVATGPEPLAEVFVAAAARIFDAPWALLLVDHEAFAASPHLAVATRDGPAGIEEARRFVDAAPLDPNASSLQGMTDVLAVPLTWDGGGRGWLATGLPVSRAPDETDRSLLSTLGHQLVAAVRSAHLFVQAAQLRDEADRLYREAAEHSLSLAKANRRLRHISLELARAREQELINGERQRIARDLHDTVAQQVLAIGMKIEWCRASVEGTAMESWLLEAKELARATVGGIRAAISDLTSEEPAVPGGFITSLEQVAVEFRQADFDVVLQLPRNVPSVPLLTGRALVMVVHEALANVAFHANATAAWIQVGHRGHQLRLAVDDNGAGDPVALREHLRSALNRTGQGYHRGLVNSYLRVRGLGGSLSIQRSGRGGVRILAVVPLDIDLGEGD